MKFLSRHLGIAEAVRMVSRGQIALPAFQRDFVWSPVNVIELIESLSKGWPVGSLLLLEGPQPFATKAIDGVKEDHDPREAQYFLLDGQQRVTALYHVLEDTGDTIYYVDLRATPRLRDEQNYPVVQWSRRDRNATSYRGDDVWTLRALLNHRTSPLFLEMSREKREYLSAVSQHVLGPLLDGEYDLPAIVMRSDIDLEALTRIFETLNRTGTRLDAFDLMVAIVYNVQVDGVNVDLRSRWDEACRSSQILNPARDGGLGPKPIEVLKLIALWQRRLERDGVYPRPQSRRVMGVRQSDVLNIPGGQVVAMWDEAIQTYVEALEWIRKEGGVVDGRYVPSWSMVLTLADSFKTKLDPDARRYWYWTSIASQSYSQGANTQVIVDVDQDNEKLIENPRVRLYASLGDDARRNKILRFGLRGLLIASGALDPISLTPLSDGPISPFVVGADGVLNARVAPTDMVARIGYCSRDSLRQISNGKVTHAQGLDPSSLQSQGLSAFADNQALIAARASLFIEVTSGGLL